jgi:hypothetical protein
VLETSSSFRFIEGESRVMDNDTPVPRAEGETERDCRAERLYDLMFMPWDWAVDGGGVGAWEVEEGGWEGGGTEE